MCFTAGEYVENASHFRLDFYALRGRRTRGLIEALL